MQNCKKRVKIKLIKRLVVWKTFFQNMSDLKKSQQKTELYYLLCQQRHVYNSLPNAFDLTLQTITKFAENRENL